jgi:hypothetical protein
VILKLRGNALRIKSGVTAIAGVENQEKIV